MTASMLEVYNEMLQDLLKEDASKPKRKAQPMDEQKPPPKPRRTTCARKSWKKFMATTTTT